MDRAQRGRFRNQAARPEKVSPRLRGRRIGCSLWDFLGIEEIGTVSEVAPMSKLFITFGKSVASRRAHRFISIKCALCSTIAAGLLFGANWLQAGEELREELLANRQIQRERRWEIALETGWIFGVRNPNNYVIAPQLLSVAWQPFPQWMIGRVRIRGQILATFLGEAIVQGPESYFLGGALRLRLIFPIGTSRWALYGDGGAGMGGVDSDDTPPWAR
jgi:hypothetical protein